MNVSHPICSGWETGNMHPRYYISQLSVFFCNCNSNKRCAECLSDTESRMQYVHQRRTLFRANVIFPIHLAESRRGVRQSMSLTSRTRRECVESVNSRAKGHRANGKKKLIRANRPNRPDRSRDSIRNAMACISCLCPRDTDSGDLYAERVSKV